MERRGFLKSGIIGAASLMTSEVLGKMESLKMEPIKLGIIGMGSRGGGISTVLKSLSGFDVVGLSDIMDEPLLRFGLEFPAARTHRDYRGLLDDSRVEAVIIALPEHLHFQVARDSIQAGKHVYLEKTMTHTIEEAERLVELVRDKSDLVFQTGHQYRYFKLYHKIQSMVKAGLIGEVKQYECQYHRNSNWRKPVSDPKLERQINWRMYKEYSGGLMTELCSHQVDILNWYNGSHPLSVSAVGGIDYWNDGRETFDNIRAIYTYPNGVKASVSSILTNAYRGYSIRILGTNGTIEVQQNRAFAYSEVGKRVYQTVDGVTGATAESWSRGEAVEIEFQEPGNKNLGPTAYALRGFVQCIREATSPLSNVETGQITAKSVLIANKAAEMGVSLYWK